jgi:hypothetical protein
MPLGLDDTTLFFIILASGALLAVVIASGAISSANRMRIRTTISRHGGQVRVIRRALFGPGWLENDRLPVYRVEYVDNVGAKWVGYCKTSVLSGVYWTRVSRMDQSPDTSNKEATPHEIHLP